VFYPSLDLHQFFYQRTDVNINYRNLDNAMFSKNILFLLFILSLASKNVCADLEDHSLGNLDLEIAEKKIVTISQDRIEPNEIILTKADSSVFFYNNTLKENIEIKIDVTGKTLHCASSNLKVDGDFLSSSEPIKPKDFALTCFPDKGEYAFDVIRSKQKPLKGKIKVEF